MNRNKYLTEAMGLCWHAENKQRKDVLRCVCSNKNHHDYTLQRHIEKTNINFSTWQGFGTLWEWSIKQEDWADWLMNIEMELDYYINPDKFADALYKFLIKRENEPQK